MLLMRDHGVEDYTALSDIDATDIGVLSDDDRTCLADLGAFLVDSRSQGRFAVWLLHKHFHPAADEVFVERPTPGHDAIETMLLDRSGSASIDVSASSIRFGAAIDSGVSIVAMEFADLADFGSTSPLSADDEAVLAGLAERLRIRGKVDRFGLKLIRNPLGLGDDDLLMETCDSARRTLRCVPVARGTCSSDRAFVETAWRFRVVEGATAPEVMQDCTAGCIAVGEGHDLSHRHSQTDNDDNPIYP